MSTTVKFEVRGLRELGEALKALPAEVASKNGGPLRGALMKGAMVVVGVAKANARNLPVSDVDERDEYIRTGRLERSIRAKRDRNPKDVTERVVVKPRGGQSRGGKPRDDVAPYWDEVEFGTAKMPARPFMRPAAAQSYRRVVEVFKDSLGKGIERAARKARRLGLTGG